MNTRMFFLMPALLLLAAGAFADTPIKMGDLPAAVQQTVREQSKGGAIRGLAKEVENGKTLYEVELKMNGRNRDVLIDPSGKVVEIEEEVAVDSLPAAVKAGLEKQTGKGRIIGVESITRDNAIIAYEAKIWKAGKTSEVKIGLDGSMMK